MTNEEINIAVAIELGLKNPRLEKWCGEGLVAIYDHVAKQECHSGSKQRVPQFTTSLDACAEFEKTLPEELWQDYHYWICRLSGCDESTSLVRNFHAGLTATPLQRREAYLRVRGKWIEEKGKI